MNEKVMKESSEIKNTQQWCPEAENVIVLSVRGAVKGNLIDGVVEDCNNHNCKVSPSKSFCWIKRKILTSLW